MRNEIRVRRHTDGRVALHIDGAWLSIPGEWHKDASRCTGPGWAELLVAELPEEDDTTSILESPPWPKGWRDWSLTTVAEFVACREGMVDIDGILFKPDQVRFDALKMLAADAACKRYREEIRTNAR